MSEEEALPPECPRCYATLSDWWVDGDEIMTNGCQECGWPAPPNARSSGMPWWLRRAAFVVAGFIIAMIVWTLRVQGN